MGSAIAGNLKNGHELVIFDKDPARAAGARAGRIAASIAEAAGSAHIILLAVKPQDFDEVLADIAPYAAGKLVISIAAGLPTRYIEKRLGEVKVIRTMPNLPAKIGKGMICICPGAYADAADLANARELFSRVGTVLEVNEDQMDSMTAVSGSGPGFIFGLLTGMPETEWDAFARDTFMPALSRAAQDIGIGAREAAILASITTAGSIALLQETRIAPDTLCSQVASKGGTTEAGLRVLAGDVANLGKAVIAARDRARELSHYGENSHG